jgi:hypothetical protein
MLPRRHCFVFEENIQGPNLHPNLGIWIQQPLQKNWNNISGTYPFKKTIAQTIYLHNNKLGRTGESTILDQRILPRGTAPSTPHVTSVHDVRFLQSVFLSSGKSLVTKTFS